MSYDNSFDWNHLDTGLPDDFIGKITKPVFTRDPDYNDGNTLFLGVELVDPANPGDQPYSARFTVGDGWEEASGGQEVVRTDGKARNFNENTGMGLFIGGLRDSGVNVNELVQARQAIPTQAAFFNGLTCHFNAVEKSFKNDAGEEIKYRRLVPDSVIDGAGANGAQPASAPVSKAAATPAAVPAAAPAPAAQPAAAPVSKAAASVPLGGGIAQPLVDQIYAIAMGSDTTDQFMERCVAEIREASTDAAVLAAIENLEGPGSIWVKAVADFNAANPAS